MCVLSVLRDEERLMRDQLRLKGCSTRWTLIRELWKGEANPNATAAASNLHPQYGKTVRNDAGPSKTAAIGTMLKDLLSHVMAFILISWTCILVVLFTAFSIHCQNYNASTKHFAIFVASQALWNGQAFYSHWVGDWLQLVSPSSWRRASSQHFFQRFALLTWEEETSRPIQPNKNSWMLLEMQLLLLCRWWMSIPANICPRQGSEEVMVLGRFLA